MIMAEKKLNDLNKTEKTAIILTALHKEGFNDNEASKLLEVSRSRVCHVHKKINSGVLNPLVNKAKRSVKLLLEGKPVGQMKNVSGSDVLQAAKMVLDRADPIIQKNENINKTYTYELKEADREKYKRALGIVDAEYEVLPPPDQKLIEAKCSVVDAEPSNTMPSSEPTT
jgi:predicted XRE-type DNA-binding protein